MRPTDHLVAVVAAAGLAGTVLLAQAPVPPAPPAPAAPAAPAVPQAPPAPGQPAAPEAPGGAARGGRGAGLQVPPLTPSPSRVLAPGATVEKVAGDFIFTEGPTTDKAGNVFFVDQDNNRIMKYDVNGQLTTFLQPSGYPNGMTFDNQGNLIAVADEKNEIWSINIATKQVTPLFNAFEGKLLNGPNDIWVHPTNGRIYFTDPYYQRRWWNRGPRENPETVYMYSPADRSLRRVIDDITKPNGIIGTPDGRTLYVADIGARQTLVYDFAPDGTPINKRVFCEFGSDGLTLDNEGHVYLTMGRAVQVFDRTGERIETIAVPENPSNVAFGGKDMQTLFITARTGFYAVKTRVKGVGPQ